MATIGIDIGSTNVKAVLLDSAGRPRSRASRPLRWLPADPDQPRRSELDASALLAAAVEALAAVSSDAVSSDPVVAIGCCGQYSSIVPVDAAATPLAPMRTYLDTRGTAPCQAILERSPEAFFTWIERHPIPPIGGGLALGHLLAFAADRRDLWADTQAYLEPVDLLTSHLTGRITATQSSMFASQLVDNRSLGARGYDPELVGLAGIDLSRLPPLVGATDVVGSLRTDLVAQIGLPPSTEVVAGTTDTHAGALATGAHVPGRVGIALGTTAVVLDTTDAIGIDLDHEVLSMPGIRPAEYLVWAENGLAGRVVEHVLGLLAAPSGRAAGQGPEPHGATTDRATGSAPDVFAGFERSLAASPAGARGLRFLPWLAGSLAPQADSAVRGGFVGMSLQTDRDDLVRAAVEGVAHNLRWLLGPVEEFTGRPATEVVLSGGPARSPGWSQVMADVLQRRVRTVGDPGSSGARAMAVWAALAVGAADGEALDRSMADGKVPGLGSTWDRTHEPDPSTAAIHAAAQDQFTETFAALRPLHLGRP